MHQYQANAQAVHQRHILNKMRKTFIGNRPAAKSHHKGITAMAVDIGRCLAEPGDERIVLCVLFHDGWIIHYE